MSQRQVGFLRAINVGGHVVKMEALRAALTKGGLANVQTFIASGNVIFDSAVRDGARLERTIERLLHDALGYEVATFVRSPAEIHALSQAWPFGATARPRDGETLFIGFLKAAPDAGVIAKVEALSTNTDTLTIVDRELFWLCRTSSLDSPVSGVKLERALGQPTTMRNVNTVRRLTAKFA